MTDWKVQKTIDYLANLNVGLPDSDWDDFLSRKSAHDIAIKRHRQFLTAVISIPAAAAVLLLLILMPYKKVVPDNPLSQNNTPEPKVITDSIESPRDTITIATELKHQVDTVKPKDSVRVKVDERLKGKYAGAKVQPQNKPLVEKTTAQKKDSASEHPSINYGMTGGNNLAQDKTGSNNTGILSENTGMSSIGSVNVPDSSLSRGFGGFGGVSSFGGFGGGLGNPETFGGFGGFSGTVQIFAGDSIRGYVFWREGFNFNYIDGMTVDEIDSNGIIKTSAVTDQKGYFSIRCANPSDSLYVHGNGYESVKVPINGFTLMIELHSSNLTDSIPDK